MGDYALPTGRRIGYARVDTDAAHGDLRQWVADLRHAGACEVHTDIGPLPEALSGLIRAVSRLEVGDRLIYPAQCLSDLTLGDTPDAFGHIPNGTSLMFFEPDDTVRTAQGIDFQTIRLCGRSI